MFSKLIANAAYTYMIYTTSSQRASCPQRCHIVRLKEVTKSAKYDCSLPNHFCTTSELRHKNTTIFLRSRHLQTRCQWVNMNPQRNNVLQHKLNQLIYRPNISILREEGEGGGGGGGEKKKEKQEQEEEEEDGRSIWVRDWMARRPQLGLYGRLMIELRNENPRAFLIFMKMRCTLCRDRH